MYSIQDKTELAKHLDAWRRAGQRIAVVPTMGNLHDGHLSLVKIAQGIADKVVVTLFVNPTQFSAGEDFTTYPRSVEADSVLLRELDVDLLFSPDIDSIYPFGLRQATQVTVPGFTDDLCGIGRPHHFDGVCSVLARLFAISQPDVAVFGQKDFQQQLLVRRLITDLGFPIEVVTGPIVREADGLAMSSRNAKLGPEARQRAPLLFAALQNTAQQLQAGESDFSMLETQAKEQLTAAGAEPEYFAIRQAEDLAGPNADCEEFAVLVAARFGEIRLIDNVIVAT